jgi:hypothetical protein
MTSPLAETSGGAVAILDQTIALYRREFVAVLRAVAFVSASLVLYQVFVGLQGGMVDWLNLSPLRAALFAGLWPLLFSEMAGELLGFYTVPLVFYGLATLLLTDILIRLAARGYLGDAGAVTLGRSPRQAVALALLPLLILLLPQVALAAALGALVDSLAWLLSMGLALGLPPSTAVAELAGWHLPQLGLPLVALLLVARPPKASIGMVVVKLPLSTGAGRCSVPLPVQTHRAAAGRSPALWYGHGGVAPDAPARCRPILQGGGRSRLRCSRAPG